MQTIIAMVVLTLLAAAGGGLLGLQIASTVQTAAVPDKPKTEAAVAAEQRYVGDLTIKELPPMVANLTAPENAWIRLQAALVYSKKDLPEPDHVAAQIADDILAYLRTLTAAELQGPSGLQHLREDLNDRVATRSEGHVRELVVETMVVQ